jgi:hypothetical protein
MALTMVVTSGFFDRLIAALREMEKDERVGAFSLAMLVPSKVFNDSWSLIVASKQLDRMSVVDGLSVMLELKKQYLSKADQNRVDGVRVLRTSQSTVQLLAQTYEIKKLGVAYQAPGAVPLILDLDDPVLLVANAA